MQQRRVHPATVTFGVMEAAALPLLIFWGRHKWFSVDDWDFLAARRAGDVGDLFRPHFEHWVTGPVLIYRALFAVFGMHSYLPYQLVVIALHLTAVALLYVLMLRIGVSPWIATATALILLFFGGGADDILVAVQLAFLGAFVLGLAQLLLTFDEGPIRRRDFLGLLAGLGALTFSSVAIPMVLLVGLVVLGRRGWRAAALQTVPLAIVYLTWKVSAPSPVDHLALVPSVAGAVTSAGVALRSAFGDLGFFPGAGAVAAIVLLVGAVLAWSQDRRRLIVPVAFVATAVGFVLMIGWGRSGHLSTSATPTQALLFRSGVGHAGVDSSRYVYLVVALMLPALAVAVDALIRRWGSRAAVVPVLLLALALPAGVSHLASQPGDNAFALTARHRILAVPHLPIARRLPRRVKPESVLLPYVTVGWLVDNAGRLPSPGPLTAAQVISLTNTMRAVAAAQVGAGNTKNR